MAKKSSDTHKDPSGLPKHQNEQKLAHEQELASQRVQQNGQSIFTMWALIQAFANSSSPVFLCADCKLILDAFKQFTCLTPQKFDIEDHQFLSVFLQKFVEGKKARFYHQFFWEKFLESFLDSQEFRNFEEKFATRVVIPVIQTVQRNFLQISDKLGFFEKLVKFSKFVNVTPSSDQLVSGFYCSAGLSKRDGEIVSQAERAEIEATRKTRKAYDKLTASNAQLTALRLENQECLSEFTKKSAFITRQLEFETLKNADLEFKIAELQLLLQAFEQQKSQELPICSICTELTVHGSVQKVVLTSCCGKPMHEICLDMHKAHSHNQNPPCPNCRDPNFTRCHLSGNHPLLRQPEPVRKEDASIGVCEGDFLREMFGEIEAIPRSSLEQIKNSNVFYPLSQKDFIVLTEPQRKSPYAGLLAIHLRQSSKPQGGGGAAGGEAGGGAAGGGPA
jgi:hypothetical protein